MKRFAILLLAVVCVSQAWGQRAEEVTFRNDEAGIELHGTLTMPTKGRNFPAVVLVTGSGIQNRDEELFGHKPFEVLAEYLTSRGIAVLRYDDRGYGLDPQEAGPVVTEATTEDFADDAAAAVEFLKRQRGVDARRVGIAGHSEGGEIAFMVAAGEQGRIAFVVSMAGPGISGTEVSVRQVEMILLGKGMPDYAARRMAEKQRGDLALLTDNTPEFVEANLDSIARAMVPGFALQGEETKEKVRTQILASNNPWVRFFLTHDPADDISQVKVPVLAINGSLDIQVNSTENLTAIEAALERAGNESYKIIEYEGLNHLFQQAETGSMDEYATLGQPFTEQVLSDIAEWILGLRR